jgi:hypothetical protein
MTHMCRFYCHVIHRSYSFKIVRNCSSYIPMKGGGKEYIAKLRNLDDGLGMYFRNFIGSDMKLTMSQSWENHLPLLAMAMPLLSAWYYSLPITSQGVRS